MACVRHCQSISVNSLPAPPLTISTLDSQTLCPEERMESGGGEVGEGEELRRRGGEGKRREGGKGKRGSGVK